MDDKIQQALLREFALLFPQGSPGHSPNWQQEPYKSDLFKVFRSAYESDCPEGDHVWNMLRDFWFPRRDDLTEEDKDQVWKICEAWSEWKYALDNSK